MKNEVDISESVCSHYRSCAIDISERFGELMESAPDAMLIVDTRGHIRHASTQATSVFGYSNSELMGQMVEILMPSRFSKDHVAHRNGYLPNAKRRPMEGNRDMFGLRKNGEEFPVEISINPVQTKEGKMICVAIRDVTKRKQLEKALAQVNKNLENKIHERTQELELRNRELEQFAYVASHDLQEPLRTIISFVELLESENIDNFENNSLRYMKYISDASIRMRSLVNALLDYSRLGRNGQLEIVDYNLLVREVLEDLNSTISETEATFEISKLPQAYCYKTEMRLLFQNLISNAIKFRHLQKKPKVKIRACNKANSWKFSVTDNGIGIDRKHQERVFTIFQRLHNNNEYQGTGIGLAHCKKIVEIHGGKIWIDSQLGHGSTFYVTIPKKCPVA